MTSPENAPAPSSADQSDIPPDGTDGGLTGTPEVALTTDEDAQHEDSPVQPGNS